MCLPAIQGVFRQADATMANGISNFYNTCLKPVVDCIHRHIGVINVVAMLAFSWMAITISPYFFVFGTISGAIQTINGSETLQTIYNIFNNSILNNDTLILSFTTGMALVIAAPPFMSLITGWFVGHSAATSM